MDEKLKCKNCGNDKTFYREVTLLAKLKVNNKKENLKIIYDIDKDQIDNYFEPIYCAKCGEIVESDIL